MILNDFKVEQWMNDHEKDAVYNLTDTCAVNLTLDQLLELETLDFSEIVMDYGDITGDTELKKEILSLYTSGTIDQITTTHGCIQANELVMATLLEKGDHVITCIPGYQQFSDYPKSIGCTVSELMLNEEKGWMIDIQDFVNAIQDNTKMIILNNPNNPTGTLMKDEFLLKLVHLAKDKGIYILCDEVYRGYETNDVSSISDLYELGISTSSLSKLYGLAALRLGWIKANKEIINQINVRRDYALISTGPLLDKLGAIALKHKEILLKRSYETVQKNKQIITSWLKENPKFSLVMPESGTVSFLKYSMPISSVELCKRLLKETGVFFVPGKCFGIENHLRLGLAKQSDLLIQGLNILSNWTNESFF